MPASQRIVQICLFILAAIALFGGVPCRCRSGSPTPRRGSTTCTASSPASISDAASSPLWAAITIRQQGTLDLPDRAWRCASAPSGG